MIAPRCQAPRNANKAFATPSRIKLALTFSAQIYNQLITIAIQLLLVPVLLHFWGAQLYGAWILLSAIPTYLSFTDFGFTLSAKNEMTIKAARHDKDGALATYQSIFMLLNMIAIVVCLSFAFGFSFIDPGKFFSLGNVPANTSRSVLLLLGANVILSQYSQLFAAGMRCAGHPAEEVLWGATARLGEGLANAGAAIAGGDIAAASIVIAVTRVGFIFAAWLRLRHLAPWLALGAAQATLAEIGKLWHPSLGFMFVSFGQALMIQGPVVVLGLVGSPIEVVTFSTSRTLARLGTSAGNMLNYALTPEYSRLFGSGHFNNFNNLVVVHFVITLVMTLIYSFGLWLEGGSILDLWTHGKVEASGPFFLLLILAVGAEMIWSALFIPLAAINQHIYVAYAFVGMGVFGIVSACLGGQAHGLAGVAAPLLLVHGSMIIITGILLWRLRRPVTKQERN